MAVIPQGTSSSINAQVVFSADHSLDFYDVVLAYDVDGDMDLEEAAAVALRSAEPADLVSVGGEIVRTGAGHLRALLAYPNPLRGPGVVRFETDHPAQVEVQVLDIQGRLVRRLAHRLFDSGVHELGWDGRNGAGLAAPGGRYLVEVTAKGPDGTQARALTSLCLTK